MISCKGNADVFRKYTSPENFEKIVDDGDLCRMWQRCAFAYAERTAVVYDGCSLTYMELNHDIADLRSVLIEKKCVPEDRIAILCANSIDFVRAFFAVITTGCTAVILPTHLDSSAVFGCCGGFGCKAIICQEQFLPKCDILEKMNPDMHIIPPTVASAGISPICTVSGKTPCVIMFTGGTTGKSKGALLSHEAVMQGIINGCYGIDEFLNQRYLLALPLSHVFGLIRNLLASIYTGSTLAISTSTDDFGACTGFGRTGAVANKRIPP